MLSTSSPFRPHILPIVPSDDAKNKNKKNITSDSTQAAAQYRTDVMILFDNLEGVMCVTFITYIYLVGLRRMNMEWNDGTNDVHCNVYGSATLLCVLQQCLCAKQEEDWFRRGFMIYYYDRVVTF